MKPNQSIPMLLMGMALCSGIQAQSLDATDLSRNNEDGVVKINPRERAYRENQILVKFRESSPVQMRKAGKRMAANISAVDALFAELGIESAEQLMPQTGGVMRSPMRKMKAINGTEMTEPDMSTLYKLDLSASTISVEEACAKFSALTDEVEYAEPNYIVYALSDGSEGVTYDDPLYSQQWGIPAINLDKLWNEPKITSKRPVIAILDTGVDITHPDLAANIWTNKVESEGEEKMDDDSNGFIDDIHGWDFVNQSSNMRDNNGHGTHCAGIAGAVGGNGIGVVGANPDAFIMPITVLQSDGTGDIATIIKGVDYASKNGADILSMSFGTYSHSLPLEQALGKAYSNAVLVAAAGNDAGNLNKCCHPIAPPMFPAAFQFVIGVEASENADGSKAKFSNWDCNGGFFSVYPEDQSYNYELRAPGSDILSTYPSGKYKILNGTSMACPLVAGAISSLLQRKDYNSKESLFGDLILCSKGYPAVGVLDALSSYKMMDTDKSPILELLSYVVDDSELGDGDGNFDSGEILSFYPTIKNFYGIASNITFSIELAENEDPEVVSIITKSASFGKSLSAYSKAVSDNPVILKINKNCVDGRHINLRIKIQCGQDNVIYKDFIIIVTNAVELGGTLSSDLILDPNNHYVVTKNLGVPSGITLTLNPGTVLKIKDGVGISINGNLVANGTSESRIKITKADLDSGTGNLLIYDGKGNLQYTDISEIGIDEGRGYWNFNKCNLTNLKKEDPYSIQYYFHYQDRVIFNYSNFYYNRGHIKSPSPNSCFSNFVENEHTDEYILNIEGKYFNIVNNKYNGDIYNVIFNIGIPDIYSLGLQYIGSSREKIARRYVWDSLNPDNSVGFGAVDLTNMQTRPSSQAPGIVWKVAVNGKDAQDEFDELPPLGVGKHKFEVYFNKPMDKNYVPSITMGVRSPYTQTSITEDGEWNEDGDVYTAYLTINSKSSFDGLNRIRVYGAQDLEHFEIPEEYYRFNVMVQKAGSMSTGLMAEPGLGKVNLTWETAEEDFADLMGYNVYRTQENSKDTIMVNDVLIDATETSFTDYDVVPGTTYYYMVKEMGTDLQQHDISNVVACTPLTASKGDANGSMSVDVADVVTEIAYLTNQNPQPFIFEAADVNEDQSVDILDVVGTLNIIITPSDAAIAGINEEPAVYTIEDDILYVETPVTLGGIQAIVNIEREGAEISTLDDLKGFEQTSAWLNDNQYVFLAYSMSGKTMAPGKHALLRVGNTANVNLVLSDAKGKNVETVNGNSTRLTGVSRDAMEGSKVVVTDLTGRVVSDKNLSKGFYLFSTYSADGQLIQTEKVVLE